MVVVYLNITNEDSRKRQLVPGNLQNRNNRIDDTEEILMTRLSEFQDKTIPVIEYYKTNGLLIEVDGRLIKNEVTKAIIDALLNFAKQKSLN